MQHVWELPYRTILIYGGIVFVAAEILFVIFTARIAGRAYDESRARVKEYYVTLMELEELYEKEGEEGKYASNQKTMVHITPNDHSGSYNHLYTARDRICKFM